MDSFKRCSCGTSWLTRESFLDDPDIQPIGVALAPRNDREDLYYYFNHAGCRSTLMMPTEEFRDLIAEPILSNVRKGQPECGDHCNNIENLTACDNDCRNAPFRRLLLDLMKRKRV